MMGFFIFAPTKIFFMGRGDKKTAKGKRTKGSFGKSRPANKSKKRAPAVKPTATQE